MTKGFSDYITAQEAAEILGLTPESLRRKAREAERSGGSMPLGAVKRGRDWFFIKVDVERYARAVEGKSLNDPTRGREL